MNAGQLIATLTLDMKPFEKGLKKAQKDALSLGTILKNAFSVTLGMGMFEAIKKGIRSVAGASVDFNSMLQTAQIGFATMLGSAEKAQKFLDDMADFAVKNSTVFEFPGLVEASKRMLAYGFAAEEVLPTLQAVGDTAAAVGSGAVGIDRITLALGQIRAKGKLSAEEMRQLTEAGVPAWEILADAIGKTTAEVMDMASKGLIPAEKAVKMLTQGMTKRFGGMMENMKDTWQGVTSSIKNTWGMLIRDLTSGLFGGVLEWLKGIRDTASNFYNLFSTLRQQGIDTANALRISIAQVFGVDLATAISTLINAAQTAWKILINTAATIKKHWSKIKPVIVGVASAFLLFKVVPPIVNAVNLAVSALHGTLTAGPALFTFISKVIGIYRLQMHLASLAGITHVGVLKSVQIALYSVYTALGPIGWILLAVAALLGVGTALWNKYAESVQNAWEDSLADKMKAQQEKLKDSISGATDATLDQADAITEVGKAADKNLQSFDEVHNIMEETADLAGLDLGTIQAPVFDSLEIPEIDIDFSAMLEEQKPTLAGFWDWIKQGMSNTAKKIGDFFSDLWGKIKQGAGDAWDGIKTAWGNAKDWFNEKIGQPVGQTFSNLWGKIRQGAIDAWGNIKTTWNDAKDWFNEKIGQPVGQTFSNLWGKIKQGAIDTWENIKLNWNNTKNWFNENIGLPVGQTFSDLWENTKQGAIDAWNNLKTAWNDAGTWFRENVTLPMGGFFKDTWESIKQGAANAWTWVKEKWRNSSTWFQENVINPTGEFFDGLFADIADWGKSAYAKIKSTFGSLGAWFEDHVTKPVGNFFRGMINNVIDGLNWLIRGLNKISITVPDWVADLLGMDRGSKFGFNISEIPKLAAGTNYVPQDMFAMLHEGEAVVPKKFNPAAGGGFDADMIEQAVYRGITSALRITQASARQDDRDLVLKIDNTVLARMQLPALLREGQRQGLNLVLQGG